MQFFKDSNELLTGVYKLFSNNNEDFTYYQLDECHQDYCVDIAVENNGIIEISHVDPGFTIELLGK